jgi:hypothetical protein
MPLQSHHPDGAITKTNQLVNPYCQRTCGNPQKGRFLLLRKSLLLKNLQRIQLCIHLLEIHMVPKRTNPGTP